MMTPGVASMANDVGYCLAVAAERHGVLLHAVTLMSNHGHLDATDARGAWTGFKRDFMTWAAKVLNWRHKRREAAWGETSEQVVRTWAAAKNGMRYTIANPVRAGLVATPRVWPGLVTPVATLPREAGTWTELRFERPAFFKVEAKGGTMPAVAVLRLVPHPLAGEAVEAGVRELAKAVAEDCADKRREMRREGRRFKGVEAVKARAWFERPETEEAAREVRPRFAEPDAAVRAALLVEYRWWLVAYRKAREAWMATGHAVFPRGTDRMREWPGVTIEDGPLLL